MNSIHHIRNVTVWCRSTQSICNLGLIYVLCLNLCTTYLKTWSFFGSTDCYWQIPRLEDHPERKGLFGNFLFQGGSHVLYFQDIFYSKTKCLKMKKYAHLAYWVFSGLMLIAESCLHNSSVSGWISSSCCLHFGQIIIAEAIFTASQGILKVPGNHGFVLQRQSVIESRYKCLHL